jgi:Cys-rich protein (TIGR01571 family)
MHRILISSFIQVSKHAAAHASLTERPRTASRNHLWRRTVPATLTVVCLLGMSLPPIVLHLTSQHLTFNIRATYCNLHWLLVFLQRTEVRDTFSLKGNSLVDLILGCYCPCCALIQQAKEVETKQRLAGYSAQGYRAPQGMAMTPQAQGVTLTRQV